MKYISIIIAALLIMIMGCDKTPNTYTIEGRVINKQLGDNLEGVKVYLDAKKIENGVYNSSFVNIKSSNTDGSGSFNMDVEEAQVSDYRFRVSETGYFSIEEEVSVDKIHNASGYNKTFELIQQSWIELNVKNTMPQGTDDKITYRYSNIEVTGKNCCNNNVTTGEGYDYEAHHRCSVRSHAWIYIYWTITKAGNQSIHNDSIYSGDGITVIYNINY